MFSRDSFSVLGFVPKENAAGVFAKKYPQANDYCIEVDFEKQSISYGSKIKAESKTTQNFSQPENFVVLECVNRLLEKGYKPENIVLEKTWGSGHGTSGRLDICVTRDDGSEYLLIECKTLGKEFDKEFTRMKKDGGQLFTYFKFSNKPDIIMLYASEIKGKEIIYRNEIVKIEEDYRTGDVKDFYEKWNKLSKDNGVFDPWVKPYNFQSRALTKEQLKEIRSEDSGFIFNQFLEILRHNVVSDKPNAFNKIFTLFLCKVYDEKTAKENEELKFQWREGIDKSVGENAYIDFLIRLTDLYQKGMLDFLERQVTDFSEEDFNKKYGHLNDDIKKDLLREFIKIRLEKNNEFAIKEVFDNQSFLENAKIVKEVVELLQNYRIRYNKRQQYLSDFFELLLTTGLKQESGQFFTPVPIAQFIIKSLPIDKFVDEKLEKGEKNNLLPYIIDYAAGSGHFLTESMHEIQRLIDQKKSDNYISDTAKKIKSWQTDHFDWATQYIYGVEKDYRLVKVGKVGCYLHGDGLANVILSDGLANFKNPEYKERLRIQEKDFPKENKQFNIVISNPPYSVSAFRNAARDYYTEKDFVLYSSLTDNSSEIECLFVERTKQLLKDGGVAGIILPSSILSNEGIYTKTREIILKYFEIVAITELGSNTFMATGTNTVVLFIRRRNNYDCQNFAASLEIFLNTFMDNTINGIEKPIAKYVKQVWENISFNDYTTLLKNEPNENIKSHEIYKEYRKKIKFKTEKDFWNEFVKIEKEKLLYFILAYPQKVVLIKTGEKDAEKRFLGYEFSNRRGSEGIHPIQRGKTIDECTKLFDDERFDNEEKASTYIYKAFNGDYDFPIHESLKNNISHIRLMDMLAFDRAGFAKNISTAVKKKVKIESKWEEKRLDELVFFQNGLWKGEKGELEKIKVLRNTNFKLNNGHLSYDDVAEIEVEVKQLDSRKLKYGDILLEKSGGSDTQAIGRVVIFDKKDNEIYSFSNFCSRIRVLNKEIINPIYLWAILNDFYEKGGTIPLQNGVRLLNIDFEGYKKIQIPIPPLDIQQKIVAEIEVLEKKEAEAKDKVEKLKDSIKNKYLDIKLKFEENTLSNEIEIIGGGTPNTEEPKYWENGTINWLSIVDFKGDKRFVDTTEKKITELGLKNSSTKLLDAGDIIISARGTVGELAQLKTPMAFNQSCYGIKAKSNINAGFLYYALKFEIEQFRNNAYGAIFDTITTKTFDLIKIPLPPLSEQQKIVAKIEKIETQIAELELQLAAVSNQKEVVLKKYL
jgi:type I restriction enzyme M protein